MAAPSAVTPLTVARQNPFRTARALAVATVLIPFNIAWVLQLEVIQFVSWPTILSIPMNALSLLVLLVGMNKAVAIFLPSIALRQGELTLIYTLLCLSSALSGTDFLQVLASMMGYPFFFAMLENRWQDLFLSLLPPALTVSDKNALRGFYYGDTSLYRPDHLKAWLVPCGLWLGFVLLLVTAMLCLCALLQRRWSEEERLSYPLIWCPLQVTEESARVWRSGMFWWGVLVAVSLSLVQGLNTLFPSFPRLPLRGQWDAGQWMPQRPFNALGIIPFGFYPFAVGLGMLMPLDLSFSCWFFYLVHRLERVTVAALGWDVDPQVPYFPEQATATWVALCLSWLWRAKASLRPSGALLCFLGCFALLTLFGWRLGLPLSLSFVYFALYFLLSLSFTRARAELGAIAHDLPFGGPTNLLTTVLGTQFLSPRTLVALALFYWFNRSYGSHPMPFLLEGMKMAKETGIPLRPFPFLTLTTTGVTFIVFFWLLLHQMYRLGAATSRVKGDLVRYYVDIYPQLQAWLTAPTPPRLKALSWMAGAFLGTWLLMHARWQLAGLPFHPMGYALASNWSMNYLWSSLLVSWLLKATLLHYGGVSVHRRVTSLVIGLVIGEAVIASLWGALSLLLQRPTHSFWP